MSDNGKTYEYERLTIVLDEPLMEVARKLIDLHAERNPELANRTYRTSAYFRWLIVQEGRREGLIEQ